MVFKQGFLMLLSLILSYGEGKLLPTLLHFLENFNFQHLDSAASFDSIKVEIMADLSDESIAVFIDEFDKFVKPISLLVENQEKDHTNGSTLHIVSVESIVVVNSTTTNQKCQVKKGKFIKESYKSYLVLGNDKNIFPYEKTFLNSLNCYFHHQPYVYTLIQNDTHSYDLYELQIVSQKSVQLATWNNTDGNIR